MTRIYAPVNNGMITFANAQAETVLGYHAVELVAKPVEVLIPERFRISHAGLRDAYARDPQARAMGRAGNWSRAERMGQKWSRNLGLVFK